MNIAIRGSGNLGKIVYSFFDELEDYNVICFIDTDISKQGTFLYGKEIVGFDQYAELYNNKTTKIVVAINMDSAALAKEVGLLKPYGKEIGLLCRVEEILHNKIMNEGNLFWIDIDRAFLSQIETNVADNCNLNCKGCSHFCNANDIYSAPSIDRFREDLRLLRENAQILKLYLLGGEPLLNQQLTHYIRAARAIFPDSDLRLVSNGLLVFKQSGEFWDCLNETKTVFEITTYPPTKRMIDSIRELLDSRGVSYVFRGEVNSFISLLDSKGSNDPLISQKKCLASICRFLYKGRVFKCPVSALIDKYMMEYSISVFPRTDGVSLTGNMRIKEELEKLDGPIPMCRYCAEEPRVFPWEIQNNPLKEDWMA